MLPNPSQRYLIRKLPQLQPALRFCGHGTSAKPAILAPRSAVRKRPHLGARCTGAARPARAVPDSY